ncbi:hypothetical protein ACQ4LE_003513 [Meloidogyne hapla]
MRLFNLNEKYFVKITDLEKKEKLITESEIMIKYIFGLNEKLNNENKKLDRELNNSNKTLIEEMKTLNTQLDESKKIQQQQNDELIKIRKENVEFDCFKDILENDLKRKIKKEQQNEIEMLNK